MALEPVKRDYRRVGSDFELARDVQQLRGLTLLRETYVTGGSVSGSPYPGTRSLLFVRRPAGREGRSRILGDEMTPSSVFLTRDDEEWFGGPFAPGSQVATIVFDPADVARRLDASPGSSSGLDLPQAQGVLRGREPALAALAALQWRIWTRLDAFAPTASERIEIERALLAAMGAAFASVEPRASEIRLPASRRERAVRLAIAFSDVATADRLTIPQLCRVAGVSRRTLEYGFREEYGCSPARYLKERRLQRARDELAIADSTQTVTRVALRWGFSDLSQFAQDYRRRFGERPSDTLASRAMVTAAGLRRRAS